MTPHGAHQSVLVALSGGVDSSTVLAEARRSGGEVHAVTLLMQHDPPTPSAEALAAARQVCDDFAVPHTVVDISDRFASCVVERFVDEYAAGITPNPCVGCNRDVKIASLLEIADSIGCERVLTGHYARIEPIDGIPRLLRGIDRVRDQSYFLYRLDPALLARLGFPLGTVGKQEVRQRARSFGLTNAEAPDSQDVCFLAGEDRIELIRASRPQALEPGPILDGSGAVIGEHPGVAYFTVGQRRGIGIGGGAPLFVRSMDAETNSIVVVEKDELRVERITVTDTILHEELDPEDEGLTALVRARMAPVRVRVGYRPEDRGELIVTPTEHLDTAAPGQACVLYRGDLVVGGGTITCVS